ncbi:CCR4-NOT transcription complex subunit 1-like isoform X3 [Ostrea edulis]|uniref:CCR4-NOT transcription complex subunit 1-like isoform X3 n=1 Tax=Ostrea edulis TaxID=37623 RepID=UPI0024AF545C|nr:CCR4-NOT transcription complex subunit 1-like isoform X3 [Ostrea edulis]
MNLDSLSFALAEISYSVANLTKKNFKSSVAEISHLLSKHGAEADRHLFRCLFSHVDFSGDGRSSGKDFHQTQFLIQEFGSLLGKPNLVSTLCYAIDNPLHHQKSLKPSSQLFAQVSRVLKLTRVQEVVFGLALLNSSNSETRNYSAQFVKQKLPDLIKSYVDADSSLKQEGGLQDAPIEVIHLLLTSLFKCKDNFGIGTEQKEVFIRTLKKDFPFERVPVILGPLLYPDAEDLFIEKLADTSTMPKSALDASLAEMIHEAGYSCTTSIEECRGSLMQFGVREISPSSVAKVLGMMARTPTGLDGQNMQQAHTSLAPGSGWGDMMDKGDKPGFNTWNVEVFVSVIQDLAPHFNWRDVVGELDHSTFLVVNKRGLRLLLQGLNRGLQDVFPIEYIYRPWKNTEGQLSFIVQSLRNPDVFCFADYPCHTVVIDILKSAPDDDNREIVTWKSLDLVETLLRLSDSGHYQTVSEMFKIPVQNCPDMLVLALLQISPTWNTLKQELISTLMPIFLGNHSNSAVVLHYAWHCQGHSSTIRTLIMHSMAEWYMRGEQHDQGRLSRILDVAQDLKALSMLLNATPFAFVIDLACLASRREYLKLDKWLSDKIREHGEPFIQTCVNFLKRRCPQLVGGLSKDENQPQMKSQMLPTETIATMLSCLQQCASQVSQELSEAILTMVANATMLLNKPRQAPPGVVGPVPKTMPNIPPPPSNPLDESNTLGIPKSWTMSAVGNSGFPQGLAAPLTSTTTPGSPAKPGFQQITQPSSVTGLQGISSQLQSLSIQNPLAPPRNPGINTLVGQAMLKPSPPQGAPPQAQPTQATLGQQQALTPQAVVRPIGQTAGDISSIFPDIQQQFSKEVEDEANSYFQRIYNQPPTPTMSIDEVLDMLKRFKDSPDKKEKDVYECMLRNLFEEYRFFPQYPERELHTTAVLFGGIIEKGLATYMALGIALRYVLEALKKQHNSKMYFFGIAALDRFKTRLKDYPQYCQHLAAIPHFHQFPQHLIEFVKYGAQSQEPPQQPVSSRSISPTMGSLGLTGLHTGPLGMMQPSGTPTSSVAGSSHEGIPTTTVSTSTPISSAQPAAKPLPKVPPSIASATNIDTLLAGQGKEEFSVPPETVQDKVFFIFNNLSLANMVQKAEEFKKEVTEEYLPWAAQYLVMKRASIEPNFHTLYANFVDALNLSKLATMVTKETFRNIRVLLRSDKGDANFSDRTLLKNLGHWLGMLTLAKNKPILQIDIDLKGLLYEAYHKSSRELLYVVPFTAKVVESCAKSKVFKPPNPWTVAIMNALAELHQEPDLKLNLKFEIEVLCKTLNINLGDLKPGNYLKDTLRLQTHEPQLSSVKPVMQPAPITPQPEPSLILTASTPTVTTTTVTTAATVPTTSTPNLPPRPQFAYEDINTNNFATLANQIHMSGQVALLQTYPNLKQLVKMAVEKSVQELMPPVVERTNKITLTTCEQIIKKDFALDPEETRMRAAAHHMIRNMTSALALITSREPLYHSISTNLKTAFMSALRLTAEAASTQEKDAIEQAATVLATDNAELACVFIQKTAVERAIPEMDKRLATEYELRKHARNEGRRYCDPGVLTYQAERMPEQIRLKVGGVTPAQISVYEEFAHNIPGFLPTNETPQPHPGVTKPVPVQPDEISQMLEKIGRDIEQVLQTFMVPPSNPLANQLHKVIEAVMYARNSREIGSIETLLQKTVNGLMELYTNNTTEQELMSRFRDCHILVLKCLHDPRAYGPVWLKKQVTRALIERSDDQKYNLEALDCLIRNQLVALPQYDMYVVQLMDNGMNYMAVAFAMQLVQRYCVSDKHSAVLTEADFANTIEALNAISTRSINPPEGLQTLLDSLRPSNVSSTTTAAPSTDFVFVDQTAALKAASGMMHTGIIQARDIDGDPPGLHEKAEYLLREWVNMYHSPAAGRDSTKAFTAFVQQMHQQGILKNDDVITRFFRLCSEMCVDLCYRAMGEVTPTINQALVRAKCFYTLDAFVRLIALLIKHSGDNANTVTKINLLNKVLGIVAGVLLQDHIVRMSEFQQLPYHRIFIMLFIELNAPEHILENINYQVLTAFCNTFHVLRPAKSPGFSYAWLEFISHRVFIGRMLALTPQQKGWGMYAQLLIDLFKFLAPFLRNADLTKPTQMLYKGTLRVLLVLLHDFPEFLCDYHYGFCDVIPPNCVQMRNLILSAFPRNMRLPDPFTPNLKVDMLADISHPPRILINFASKIQPAQFKKDLDSYLKSRSPVTFVSDLRSYLQSSEPGTRYNIQLMNALVLYVGTQAIQFIHGKGLTPSMSTIAHSAHMDIFQNLAVALDTEGRYLFLTAIANQLRYPNSHTHYFSCTLLYLFAEANTEAIQEQITRVLLERLIVNRPHPWGLLITFIELIKNPQFKFWNHEFVHCAPEIEKLFESVARSCMQPKQNQQASTGIRESETNEMH